MFLAAEGGKRKDRDVSDATDDNLVSGVLLFDCM